MNWKPFALVCGIAISLTECRSFPADTADTDLPLLVSCYFRFLIAEQVSSQAATLTKNLPAEIAKPIRASTDAWHDRQMGALRADLEKNLGDQAQARFETFVGDFAQAEKSADRKLLARMSQSLRINPVPADYPAFRKAVVDSVIGQEMSKASRFLSEVQTWADMRGKNEDVPPLEIWLNRGTPAKRVNAASAARPKEKTPAQSLAEAEAATPDLPQAAAESAASPLETFAAKRREKHEKALSEAEAGMEQVAAERQAAEEEYAAKKLSAAQADADNMKQHAEKLAASEKDALEQRENSWGNRLKSIVGATVSAATGAFAGGVGARAGEEAVSAIFDDKHHRH